MASLLLMNFLDVARSLGPDPLHTRPSAVSAFLGREFRAGGGAFNYNSSITYLPHLFEGHATVEQAIHHCSTHGSPAGRLQNSNAIALAGAYAASQRSKCYKIPFTAVPVGRLPGGRTPFMAIKAPLLRVSGGQPFIVVPGFRLGHKPVGIEIDVAASLAVATFGRDDFSEADYEYLDCSRGSSGERELSVHRGSERRLFTLDEVDHMLGIYVAGLALAIDGGIAAPEPNFRGYKIFDPNQPRMF